MHACPVPTLLPGSCQGLITHKQASAGHCDRAVLHGDSILKLVTLEGACCAGAREYEEGLCMQH